MFSGKKSTTMKEKPMIEGYLLKRAVKSGRNWKKRYFALFGTKLMYKTKQSEKSWRGDMLLTENFFVQDAVKKTKQKYGFMVSDFDTTYYLAADKQEVKDFWMHTIARIIRKMQQDIDYYGVKGYNGVKVPASHLPRTEEQKKAELAARMAAYESSRALSGLSSHEGTSLRELSAKELLPTPSKPVGMIPSSTIEVAEVLEDLEDTGGAATPSRRSSSSSSPPKSSKSRKSSRKSTSGALNRKSSSSSDVRSSRKNDVASSDQDKSASRKPSKVEQESNEAHRRTLSKRASVKRSSTQRSSTRKGSNRLSKLEKEAQRELEAASQAAQGALEQEKKAEAEKEKALSAVEDLEAKKAEVLAEAKRIQKELEEKARRAEEEKRRASVERRDALARKEEETRRKEEELKEEEERRLAAEKLKKEEIRNTAPAPKVKKPKGGIASRVAMWQNKADDYQEKQEGNVFSGNYKGNKVLKPGDAGYGKAVAGSKTEARAKAAADWVDKEINKLIDVVKKIGAPDPEENNNITTTFGPLFLAYQDISDSLVGILMRAKRRKRLWYEGDMLFQGSHDHVKIQVLS